MQSCLVTLVVHSAEMLKALNSQSILLGIHSHCSRDVFEPHKESLDILDQYLSVVTRFKSEYPSNL